MKKLKIISSLFVIIVGIFAGGNSLFAASENITMTGSTTVLPLAQRAAESFMDIYDDISVSVRGGGSGVGIAALIDGRADIANSSRAIKNKEIELAKEKGKAPYANVVAIDGIAVVVHPDNPLNSVSIEDLKKIYTGEVKNWKALGGSDKAIVVISRDYSSGTFEVFKELVLEGAKVTGDALMLASNKAVSTTISTTPDAVGYIGLGYLSKGVKALKINGVEAGEETVREGEYKLARPLFMYTNGEPKGIIKTFMDFVFSSQGQEIARELGYVPVK